MLQRKQSLWLFIASLLNAGVFYFDLYKTSFLVNGTSTAGTPLRVSDHYPSLLIAVVMTVLPFITIFMFRNRRLQIRMSFISLLAICSFITLALARVKGLDKMVPPPSGGSYWIGAILPAVSFILIIMAMLGIRSDEKLVKSVDRLR